MASSQSLTKSHPAVKLLVKKLKDGSLSGDEKPAVVHSSDPVFSATNLANFRTAYKNSRKRLGLLTGGSSLIDGEAKLSRRCSDDREDEPSKRARLLLSSEDESEGSIMNLPVPGQARKDAFTPMVACSTWHEPRTTTKRLTVVIVLPTGMESGDFSVHVVSGGKALEFKCMWPKELVNVETLHRKWLLSDKEGERITNYHPKLLGFESFFKGLRKRASDAVQSVCLVSLPFEVETHIYESTNLQWRNSGTRAKYIELRSTADEYGIGNAEEFETV